MDSASFVPIPPDSYNFCPTFREAAAWQGEVIRAMLDSGRAVRNTSIEPRIIGGKDGWRVVVRTFASEDGP